MGAASRRGAAGIRNRALIVVLWRGGLRIGEALALRLADVDLEARSIAVLHGKGDRRRVVGIDARAVEVVGAWVERRRRLGIRRGPLFGTISGGPGQWGKPMSDAYVRATLAGYGRRAGIEKRVHAHGLRHTFAAELAAEGVPMNVIRRALGHSSLATTDRYVNHVAPEDVLEAMRRRRWPGDPAPPPIAERRGSSG